MKIEILISCSERTKTTYYFDSLEDASAFLKKEVREFKKAKEIDKKFWAKWNKRQDA